MTYTTAEVIELHYRFDIECYHNGNFKDWLLEKESKTPAYNRDSGSSLGNQIRDIENGKIVPR